ncbi:hypothetical protein ACT453_62135, partial [Bacillus sp. D-CC]
DFVNRTQLICEGSHFSMREYNLKLDDVINDQRNVIYKLRNNLLQEDTNMIEIIGIIISIIFVSSCNKLL